MIRYMYVHERSGAGGAADGVGCASSDVTVLGADRRSTVTGSDSQVVNPRASECAHLLERRLLICEGTGVSKVSLNDPLPPPAAKHPPASSERCIISHRPQHSLDSSVPPTQKFPSVTPAKYPCYTHNQQ